MSNTQGKCPRCRTPLRVISDELKCRTCGYVDYGYSPSNPSDRERAGDLRISKVRIPYRGESSGLEEQIVQAIVKRAPYHVAYEPTCPFCKDIMNASTLPRRVEGGGRRISYRCGASPPHRIFLILNEGDEIQGWMEAQS